MYEVTLIANLGDNKNLLDEISHYALIKDIPINREISLLADIKALFLLLNFFWRHEFSLVHSVSPKAGLLSMIASSIARVPNRIHTFTGQVWVTKNGFIKYLLCYSDKLINLLSTQIIVDSKSQLKFLLKHEVVSKSKAIVFGQGSISGVDLKRFKFNEQVRIKMRSQFGVKDSDVLILFLGRLKKDKGILELIQAFSKIHTESPNLILWCVGPDEEKLTKIIENTKGVRVFSYTKKPEDFMSSADIFCIPSFREGFGTAVIEAAACGIPSIGTNIYGLNDAIINGETGILVKPKSHLALIKALRLLYEKEDLRNKMGKAANERAKIHFSSEFFTDELLKFYKKLIMLSSK